MKRFTLSAWLLIPILAVVVLLLGSSFFSGAALERAGVLPGSTGAAAQGEPQGFDVFWQAWDIVQANYVDQAAKDTTKLTYGAISGMVDALGDTEHSRFLSPDDLKAEQDELAGRLEGIGAELVIRDGVPTILAPIPGSPAEKAGLKPGDIITTVDGQDVTGLSLSELGAKVRGPAGSKVTLTINRAGATTTLHFTIERAHITVDSVTWAMLPGHPVAHILISQFSQGTTDQLASALQAARQAGASAIVLDLRNNTGGLQNEAIGVASQFLSSGLVQKERQADGTINHVPVRPGGVATDIPLVTLINEGTASSSEIVAGALQDQNRAKLVGHTTFGTGTLLATYNLKDGSALLLGVAEWLTPNGRQIWHQGIKPDIAIDLAPSATPLFPSEEGQLTPADLAASSDAQLLRALQELGR